QWAFTKKAAVLSQYPTAIRAALRMEGAAAKDSVLEKESFKPLFDAHADAGLLSLASAADSLKNILAAAQMVGGMMASEIGLPAGGPLEHLPSPAPIDRRIRRTALPSVTLKGGLLRGRASALLAGRTPA